MSYLNKDRIKFSICNKLITRGAKGSSSDLYATSNILELNLAYNCKTYTESDVVGISVNGNRRKRISFDKELVNKAIEAQVTFVKDNRYHTNRAFNIGEREVSEYLLLHGYSLVSDDKYRSIWKNH